MELLTETGTTLSVQTMSNTAKFIVIDDDPLNNTICRLTIKKALGNVDVKTFTNPLLGLDYIDSEYSEPSEDKKDTVLFLDINMPELDGWQFLERYEHFNFYVKNNIQVYILSSSVDERDIEKANNNKNIVRYLSKPITKETVLSIMNDEP